MSVSTTTRKQSFVLDGVEDEYTFTFRALPDSPTDIKCYVTTAGTDTALTYTTNYTVEVNSGGIGGTVTLVSAGTIGLGTLTVYRETTKTQESDYDDYNQFPANTLETDLDKVMLIIQELTEGLDRAVKLSVTTTLTSSTLLLPTPVAGRALKWNAAANSLANTDVDIDTAIAAATASQVAAAASASAAATSATTASVQATNAGNSATTASTQAINAATSATTAQAAATISTTAQATSQSAATTSTTAQGLSQSAATTSTTQATAAATSATTAASHATTAITASTTATTQATAAATSATTAASHATTALTASTTATAQATAAATSATSALAAQTAAEATLTIPINLQTRSYILVLADVNMMVDLNSAGTINVTIPSSGAVAIPTGSVILIRQLGAGQVVITTSATVTLNVEVGAKITGQYAMAGLLKTGTDTWVATGALEA